MEVLGIKQARGLLDIRTRHTINSYLKALDLYGRKSLSWEEFRLIFEMQIFLGLRHGSNSKAMFTKMTESDRLIAFEQHGIDVDRRFDIVLKKHNVSQKNLKAAFSDSQISN